MPFRVSSLWPRSQQRAPGQARAAKGAGTGRAWLVAKAPGQAPGVARRQELMSFPGGLPLTGLVGLCAVCGSTKEIPP